MGEKFYTKLEKVFGLIREQPDGIVDDTALDRLLITLETISSNDQQNNAHASLVPIVIKFLDTVESWQHPVTVSFGLRLAGYAGVSLATVDKTVRASMVKCIKCVANQLQLMNNPTVKHGFYTSLKCLASHVSWVAELEVYIAQCLKDLSASFLYIRKISSEFLAMFLHTVLQSNEEVYSMAVVISAAQDTSDVTFMESFTKSVIAMAETDFHVAVKFMNMSDFIVWCFKVMQAVGKETSINGLLDSLVNLFGVMSSSPHCNAWEILLPCMTTDPYQLFMDLINFVKRDAVLRQQLPKLCLSLLHVNPQESRQGGWNKRMLQNIFHLIHNQLALDYDDDVVAIDNHGNGDSDVKCWKKLLTTTIDVMSKMDTRLYSVSVEDCARLLNTWLSYFFRVFEISLNHVENKTLSERLVSLINDKKIARLCFMYFKKIPYKVLEDAVKKEYVHTLWTILKCSSDSTQVMCLGLDVLCGFMQENGLGPLLSLVCQQKESLAVTLRMRLCDMTWEVRESLLTVLVVMVKECRKGHSDCQSFLEEDTFWCSFLQLLDDEESYVRAKAVSLLKEALSSPVIARVFYRVQNTCLSEIWKEIEQRFICFERQDDMFTRRSILDLIEGWIERDVISVQTIDTPAISSTDNRMYMSRVQDILANSVQDFDWETRRKCTDVIKAVVIATRRHSAGENSLQCLIDVFHGALAKLVCDCEYKVKLELVQCVHELKTSMVFLMSKITTELKEEEEVQTMNIKTFDEFQHFVTSSMQKVEIPRLSHLLQCIDFSAVTMDLKVMDDTVRNNPCSFLEDIIASAEQIEGNLLDCY